MSVAEKVLSTSPLVHAAHVTKYVIKCVIKISYACIHTNTFVSKGGTYDFHLHSVT